MIAIYPGYPLYLHPQNGPRTDRYKWTYGAPINGLINGYLGL